MYYYVVYLLLIYPLLKSIVETAIQEWKKSLRNLERIFCFVCLGEGRDTVETRTFHELKQRVAKFAAAMKKMGIKKGDRVVGKRNGELTILCEIINVNEILIMVISLWAEYIWVKTCYQGEIESLVCKAEK